MKYEYYLRYILEEGLPKADISPIFENPTVFYNLIRDLTKPFDNFNKIAGIDAIGFIIAGGISVDRKIGLVPIRKGGRLPTKNPDKESFIDYSNTKKTLELNPSAIKKSDSFLIVDDWIETGSQVKSAIKLIERNGGKIAGISALCAHRNKKTQDLFDRYNLHAIRIIEDSD